MNFVFVSPNFPRTYWQWCDRLKKNGANVLGIGDCPYDNLCDELKGVLTEYYYVANMQDYDQMFRAVAYFSFKYGKIDWLESNNEFWLAQDARLRTDFHITTGADVNDIKAYQSKSSMKPYYAKGGIPTARCHKITTKEAAQDFIKLVGYPVIVKPDVGVGASDTWKLSNDEEFENFFANLPQHPYVMEEFIFGDIVSYDAICDSNSEPVFESMGEFPPSIMDILIHNLDLSYYVAKEVAPGLKKHGRAALKAFGVRNRFVHMEFFRLHNDRPGLGKKGDFIGLEVNMRPAGGYTPDMMNYAHSCDVYQIWADMVTKDRNDQPVNEDNGVCVYCARRDRIQYVHSHDDVVAKYGDALVMCERMPEVIATAMGDFMYMARFRTHEEMDEFKQYVLAHAE